MKSHEEAYQPGEEELPEGWDPADDRDPEWNRLSMLLRDSDQPEVPTAAAFAAVRMEARRALAEQGFFRSAPAAASEIGFIDWLKVLLTGGRSGGQVIRLATVGGLALYAGLRLGAPVVPVGYLSEASDSTGDGPDMSVVAMADGEPTIQVTGLSDEAGEQRTRPASPAVAVGRSYAAERESAGDWLDTAPPTQSWLFSHGGGVRAVPVGSAVAATGSEGSGSSANLLANQALEHVQILKFYSLVNRQEQEMAHLRRVEQILTQMMESSEGGKLSSGAAAVEQYRRAEHALAARRYHEAQQIFDDAALHAPGSSVAFLARFQIGRIAFERTQDYQLALQSFRECLEQFPGLEIPSDHRRYLAERVEILTQGLADDWESLADWHAAEKATAPPVAARHLVNVVTHSPSDRLVSDAAQRLKDLAIADATERRVDHESILSALRARIQRSRPSIHMARAQFALAEIVARRSQNHAQALYEFQRALELSEDESLNRLIRSRLAVVSNERLTGVPAPD